ncbi:hypothetical protein GGQ54_001790 [Naumannella cuiyingiana]|uniref:FHA domain-containing protein n=1 Tax=Naumannella cuiyingiana TaxID=1347891 RepID=A0A7Z0D951_9ACTN|nr:FHA domain-containing protein [Naumannella cuiyingiana]NYI71230.1 hypothetical protein [Naumannella cuiyingiana]
MGSAIAVTVIKVAFLALLWIFILICASIIRTDIFGRKVATADLPHADLDEPRRGRRRQRGAPRRVVISNGPQAGIEADLAGGVVRIGRSSDCQLILDDDYVSTRHGQVTVRPDGIIVAEDLGSTNGTYVNGQRITQPTQLTPADTLRIGRTQLKLDS